MISDAEGIQAVKAARAVTEAWTEDKKVAPELPESFMHRRYGVFVTVCEYPSKDLRGCIGYPLPPCELSETLVMAARAVCSDPRFPPLKLEEAKNCTFDVTIMTEPERIEYKTLDELKSKIRIGTDGLIAKLMRDDRVLTSGLFLPQVPDPCRYGRGPMTRKRPSSTTAWFSSGLTTSPTTISSPFMKTASTRTRSSLTFKTKTSTSVLKALASTPARLRPQA